MRLPIERDSFWFLIPLAAAVFVFWALGWSGPMWTGAGLFLFVVYFFRDPKRAGPRDDDLLLAPADGTIARIDTAYQSPAHPDGAVCVSTFLSIFNVHVQRIPAAGTVVNKRYHRGGYLAAWNHKASEENEHSQITLDTKIGPVSVKQIAGLVARRIVCRVTVGQSLDKGDHMGLIRFGSRVDLIVPAGTHIVVKKGDKVKGGETVMARAKLDRER